MKNHSYVKKIRYAFLLAAVLAVFSGSMTAMAKRVEKGVYPTRRGTILVTEDWVYRILPTGHAAIVWDKDHVVEAQSQGVIVGKNNWKSERREFYGLTVKRTTREQDEKAAEWCMRQKGKPYNYNYFDKNTREKFYCSQLVWAAFKDLYNIDLSDVGWRPGTWSTAVHPMELYTSKETKTIYHFVDKWYRFFG